MKAHLAIVKPGICEGCLTNYQILLWKHKAERESEDCPTIAYTRSPKQPGPGHLVLVQPVILINPKDPANA